MDHYSEISFPIRASIGRSSPGPARFLAALLRQKFSSGLPKAARLGFAYRTAGRLGLPPDPLTLTGLAALPRRRRPDLDSIVDALRDEWERLRLSSRALPGRPPERMAALEIHRARTRTVLVFGEGPSPLVVLKPVGEEGADRDARALRLGERAAVAPRHLGIVRGRHVQEGVPGAPLRVIPVHPEAAGSLPEHDGLARAGEGLARLATTTSEKKPSFELTGPRMSAALAWPGLDVATRRGLQAALRELDGVAVSVLRHRDTSPQNILLDEGRLSALVDWEFARSCGAPGWDVLNMGVNWLEHGLGLRRWSDARLLDAFTAAWPASPLFSQIRTGTDAAIRASGAPEGCTRALTLAFFGQRVGRRVLEPASYGTSAGTAAGMLEVVLSS